MEKETLANLIALVVVCGLALLMAWVTKYRPPRQINWLYGYRTTRSMRTPAAWQEANRYFADYFWRLSLGLPVLAAAVFLAIGGPGSLLVVVGIWVLAMLIGLICTERHLQRRFDDQGNPRR